MHKIDPGAIYADPAHRLASKVAVVTGASSGHGRAIALALAAEGASLVCADVAKAAAKGGFEQSIEIDTDDLIVSRGGQAIHVQADVSHEGDLERVAEAAVAQFGKIDIWVNNAGIFAGLASVIDETVAAFERTLSINTLGMWLGCKAAVRIMRGQDVLGRSRGKIINIGSIAGVIGQADVSSYSTSKGAVHSLTRAIAIECAPLAINVNAVAPGYFPTAMVRDFFEDADALEALKKLHPWPEMGEPADVGAAVAFLASAGADWITGAILPVDGGLLAK